ncbi:hypothetical protein, partial [Bradyrhizobium acaciae]|uniref:hypothetical protein n=1 Tax=Bradyrhizobium acaciae TaxID=2683706 RepID=UPI001E50898D
MVSVMVPLGVNAICGRHDDVAFNFITAVVLAKALEPSSPRNGFAVVAGGASLAAQLRRWASLEGC